MKFIFIFIFGCLTINLAFNYYNKLSKIRCYKECSNFHYLGEPIHWYYFDFIVHNSDTIWTDRDCYNDWCVCIDECYPSLCCKYLK